MLNLKQQNLITNTPQQQAADPHANVYVAASAGTGKTKILTDRFINLLLTGSSPQNIFCVTFTTAAAEEMRHRIMTRLEALTHMTQGELNLQFENLNQNISPQLINEAYLKVIEAQHSLKIQTLHSFCLKLLETYSQFSDLHGDFHILSSYEHNQLLDKSLDAIFNTNPSLKESLHYLCNYYTLPTIKEIVSESISYNLDLTPDLNNFMSMHLADLNFDFDIECTNLLKVTNEACVGFRHFNLSSELMNFFLTKDQSPRKQLITKKEQETFPSLLDKLLDIQEKLLSLVVLKKNQNCAFINYHFYSIVHALKNEYLKNKEALKRITYDDILDKALNLLTSEPFVLYKLDYKIDHILVDEAQDLSKMQWEIIKILADEFYAGASSRLMNRTIFIVGDFKQSIYGFQGAKPAIFLEVKDYFRQKVQDAGKVWREVTQSLSYRSASNILEFVNRIFQTKFSDFANHIAHKKELGHVEVWPIVDVKQEKKNNTFLFPKENYEVELEAEQILANTIADEIESWLKKGKHIAGTNKIITPEDILIIIRKRSKFASNLANQIKKRGINITDVSTNLVTEYLLFKDLISLIKFHLFPEDDFNLSALLKSPFFCVSDELLKEIALSSKLPLLQKVKNYEAIYSKLDLLCQTLSLNKPYMAFSKILYNKELLNSFEKEFGSVTLEMFNYFLSLLTEFETKRNGSYFSLITFLEEQKYTPIVRENSVRMMTAHSSKGLQAPIVILADAASTDYQVNKKVLGDGNGNPIYCANKNCRSNYVQELMNEYTAQENSEDLRLLYVALTRAENELYLAGVENRNKANSWYEIARLHHSEELKTQPTYHEQSNLNTNSNGIFSLPLSTNLKPLSLQVSNEDYESKATKYGEIIHEMLCYLAVYSQSEYESYIASLFNKEHHLLSHQDIENAKNEAEGIYQKFPNLFTKSDNVLSEVAIADPDNILDVYRLDKLIIDNTEVTIIDFKTDRIVPNNSTELKSDYYQQVLNYKRILKSLYPNHSIKSGIIWTKSAEYMQVE